jgi:uncharacterized protein with PIN domain
LRRRPARDDLDVAASVTLRIDESLRFFLPARRRAAEVVLPHDGTSSLGHVVESAGVPLTEVGMLRLGDHAVAAGHRPLPSQVFDVLPVRRPQRLADPPRFLLDVHLGALARRMRLLGLDTAYRNDADDEELAAEASESGRVLLTQDRGLLRRRAVPQAAYVLGATPDDQLADVLDRFAPPLAPWTRCTRCNGVLSPVAKRDVEGGLEPGTRASYDEFARCASCGQVYWRGAHARRLRAVVERYSPGADRT